MKSQLGKIEKKNSEPTELNPVCTYRLKSTAILNHAHAHVKFHNVQVFRLFLTSGFQLIHPTLAPSQAHVVRFEITPCMFTIKTCNV